MIFFLFNGKICMYADFVTRVCTSKKQSNFSIYSFDALANSTLNPMELSGFFWFLKSKIEATHNNWPQTSCWCANLQRFAIHRLWLNWANAYTIHINIHIPYNVITYLADSIHNFNNNKKYHNFHYTYIYFYHTCPFKIRFYGCYLEFNKKPKKNHRAHVILNRRSIFQNAYQLVGWNSFHCRNYWKKTTTTKKRNEIHMPSVQFDGRAHSVDSTCSSLQ